MKNRITKKQIARQLKDFIKIEKALFPFLKRPKPKIEEYSSRGRWQDVSSSIYLDFRQKNPM